MSKALQQQYSAVTRIRINWMEMQPLSEIGSFEREGKWYVLMDFLNSPDDIKDGTDPKTGTIVWTFSNHGRYAAVPVEFLKTLSKKECSTEMRRFIAAAIDDCKNPPEPETLDL